MFFRIFVKKSFLGDKIITLLRGIPTLKDIQLPNLWRTICLQLAGIYGLVSVVSICCLDLGRDTEGLFHFSWRVYLGLVSVVSICCLDLGRGTEGLV